MRSKHNSFWLECHVEMATEYTEKYLKYANEGQRGMADHCRKVANHEMECIGVLNANPVYMVMSCTDKHSISHMMKALAHVRHAKNETDRGFWMRSAEAWRDHVYDNVRDQVSG